MDITQLSKDEICDILDSLPTSIILKEAYHRVGMTSINLDDDETCLLCDVLRDTISDLMYHYDIEEAKLLWAYKNELKKKGE